MKVVLFCGGLGTRLREHSDTIPKPLVTIGYRPIVWHLMRYYAHYGHTEFILCLGYRGDMIKSFIGNGGRILVCPPCAKVRGYDEASLIDDAVIAGAPVMLEEIASGAASLSF